jgi:Protein of unknown function (DUF2442)
MRPETNARILGMNISATITDPRIADAKVSASTLIVILGDGRKISAPLEWFAGLKNATPQKRSVWEISAAGRGIHWPLIDEDLSVDGLLQGTPAIKRA